jgi:hypothetical protein
MMRLFIVRCAKGYAIRRPGSIRASAVLHTRKAAITRARAMLPDELYIERARARDRMRAGKNKWYRV